MGEHGHPEPVAIPPQEDFPVEWAAPDEQKVPWQHDKMHFPEAMLPLESEFWERFMHGLHLGMAHYEMPLQTVAKTFNYWVYMGIFPNQPMEKMPELGKKSDEVVMATVHRLQERWDDEWLPEIKGMLETWDAFDLEAASTPELLAHVEGMWETATRMVEIHFEIVIPVYVALSLFDELHHDLFADDGTFDSHKLLEGFDNKSLELGRALWTLSRAAAAEKDVGTIIEERAVGDVAAALEGSESGRTFLNEMDRFLDEFGQRGSMWGIVHTSWIEDPGPVIINVKDYLARDEDPTGDLQARAAEREEALSAVRERLAGYPSNVRDQFEGLLKAASNAVVLTEDHGFWIDFKGCYRIRCAIVELGHRLAADGIIETGDDIFFLRMDEITAAAKASPTPDHGGLVAERKKELAHFAAVRPPHFMGTDYGPPPPGLVSMAFAKFFGLPQEPTGDANTLRGNAGSPGKVQGTARIIRSLDEADKLGLGEVLVAETTAPPWTPLFATAGAIVTDTGGILSHCAVVAREYRIPAVVGTGMATATISDGQTVEVDGDTGLVRIVS